MNPEANRGRQPLDLELNHSYTVPSTTEALASYNFGPLRKMQHLYAHLVPFNLFPSLREAYQEAVSASARVKDDYERAWK